MQARGALLIALLVAAVVQAVHYLPLMPARMATHFDGAGVPNGWGTPVAFFTIMLGLEVVMALSWATVRPLLRRLPNEQINFPNREYWLAPERREEAFRRFAGLLLEFGAMIQLLLITVTQLVVQANMSTPVVLSSGIALALVLFGVGTVIWLVRIFTAFPKAA